MSYMLEPGSRLGGYEIKRILGIGGFGVTYHAIDLSQSRDVAIKEYFPGIAFREKGSYVVSAKSYSHQQEYNIGLKRFYKESQIVAQFNHINIVRVLNVFEGNGTAYMVMEYEQGEDLDNYLKRIGRPLSYGEIIGFFMPVLDGLRAVHKQNVLHLDIKPDNIFIRTNSTPCLIDFGGARHYAAQESRLVVAKVSFMVAADGFSPPEQYHSEASSKGPWSDVYALGATLYACMDNGKSPPSSLERSGDLMNDRKDPLQPATVRFKGKYSQDLLELVDLCLSLQHGIRPKNAQEMQDILIKIANNEAVKWQEPERKATPPPHRQGDLHPVSPKSQPRPQGIYSGSSGSKSKVAGSGTIVNPDNFVYAGFWLRVGAYTIDSFLLAIPYYFVIGMWGSSGNSKDAVLLIFLMFVLIWWLYFAIMESSVEGGTVGKRMMRIRVVDMQGQRISFWRATGRFLSKILSALILSIGFLMAGTLVINKA